MAFGFNIAEPNEALIISGKRGGGAAGAEESQQYRIVPSGDRVFVWPILQSARRLALDLKRATVPVNCVTGQGIPVTISGVVAFKVGSDNASIANAAQRFLHQPDTMEERVHELFAGHIRGIVGSLTVEQLIRERESLTTTAREATSLDMEKMGLVIDSLQIAEIQDPSGYIDNLSKPDIARVQMESRIAQAERDREASEREAQNAAKIAAAQRDADIQTAAFRAEVDKAQAEAAQAGPRQEAESRKAVVEAETEVAQLDAVKRERQLEAEVRKPADARAYETTKVAEADRQATIYQAEAQAQAQEKVGAAEASAARAKGLADAEVIRARGESEGAALEARATGLEKNQDAVIAQQLAEKLPEIVSAAAHAFDNVGTMTVLNGADGVTNSLASIISQGGAALNAARGSFTGPEATEAPVAAANGGRRPDGDR